MNTSAEVPGGYHQRVNSTAAAPNGAGTQMQGLSSNANPEG
jgi:hypothetical protein